MHDHIDQYQEMRRALMQEASSIPETYQFNSRTCTSANHIGSLIRFSFTQSLIGISNVIQ